MRSLMATSLALAMIGGQVARADPPRSAGSGPVEADTPGSALTQSTPTADRTATPTRGGLMDRIKGKRSPSVVPPPPSARVEPSASKPNSAGSSPIAKPDATVRRTQDVPGITPPTPEAVLPSGEVPVMGGQSLSLQAALYGAITGNPDVVSARQGNGIANAPSPEAVEVARRFPTTLNPTLWIDYRPITLVPNGTFGSGSPGGSSSTSATGGQSPAATSANSSHGRFYHYGQDYIYVSVRQPIELGHQTTHRYNIAKAALAQQQWTVMQAELNALVLTYRAYQAAAYRREKLKVARDLSAFNDNLLKSLQRRLDAGQVPAADVSLAVVENRAAKQLERAAKQDYTVSLADLRNQIGIPDSAAALEPLGAFALPPYIPPVDENSMIQAALQDRPEIKAAMAQVAGACSAVQLAKGDRRPTPVIGPEYQMDEAGVQYIGFVLIAPFPVLNNGSALQKQREAETRRARVVLEQTKQRVVAQVRAAVAKWNGATELMNDSGTLTDDLAREVERLERLFEANQADVSKLLQARQRLIQLENSRLDATFQAVQAQADLMAALGASTLLAALDTPPASNPAAAPVTNPPRAVGPR